MGWARRQNVNGQQYFCPTKVARGGRADMNDKFTTYYFRYPELLLMQAELRARTGATIAEALAPINTLRNNRTNPVLSQIPEPATRNELMDIIFKEYCLELFVENGSEWFASLRFEKDGNPWFKTLKPDVSDVSTNKYCWPIPAVETNVNSQIKPNPGFDN
ncbi:MAG: RagB/SusD family nutrient uptake outer membrane protein [Butyricimonas faecihominis]